MAGAELCVGVGTVYGKDWRQWNRKTMGYEMCLSICCRVVFAFLLLEWMKIILLRAPCSIRSKQRGIIFWFDSSCAITCFAKQGASFSIPRGQIIFFPNPLGPQAIHPLSELIISYICSKTQHSRQTHSKATWIGFCCILYIYHNPSILVHMYHWTLNNVLLVDERGKE